MASHKVRERRESPFVSHGLEARKQLEKVLPSYTGFKLWMKCSSDPPQVGEMGDGAADLRVNRELGFGHSL